MWDEIPTLGRNVQTTMGEPHACHETLDVDGNHTLKTHPCVGYKEPPVLVEQSNGYFPILVERDGEKITMREGTLLGHPREDGRAFIQPDMDLHLLINLFREAAHRYREEDVDTFKSPGLPCGVVLVVKGRRNGNRGDWFLTESSWRVRILEGSGHLDDMANALESLR